MALTALNFASWLLQPRDEITGRPLAWHELDPRVFLDLAVDGHPLGRVIFRLDAKSHPLAAENFRKLCTGEHTNEFGKKLHYKGTPLHALYSDTGVVFGGDLDRHNGTGGQSVFGFGRGFGENERTFGFEQPGTLAMVSFGHGNENYSQFFVVLDALDRDAYPLSLAFGRVVSGLQVLRRALDFGSPQSGLPTAKVIVADCGQL